MLFGISVHSVDNGNICQDHVSKYKYASCSICPSNVQQTMAKIEGAIYKVGTNRPFFPQDKEAPERSVSVDTFYMDTHEVSNEDFTSFTRATRYISDAEKYNSSFVVMSLIEDAETRKRVKQAVASSPWWVLVEGASWKHPEGISSSIGDRMSHPVVHVSWNDAVQYCAWLGKRLPSEIEWEIACRGGLSSRLYPWGNKWKPQGRDRANTFQGHFPHNDTCEDGFCGTAPVDSYESNAYGLKNIVGNVWEWTSDKWNENNSRERVKKGGSFMCHINYCYRHRCAARSQNTVDSSASNLGFRCASNQLPQCHRVI